jgi:hypothetical protein
MRISHRHRFVFLAYPRAASHTTQQLLDDYADIESVHVSEASADFPFHHHMTARELKAEFDRRGWDWSEYRCFCFVRNPWARVVSLFKRRHEHEARFTRRIPLAANAANWIFRRLPAQTAFKAYVLSRGPHRGPARTLSSFIADENGRPLVDDVLRFERLSVELPAYLNALGVTICADDIPHLNRSADRSGYARWYDPTTKRKIETLYAREIEQFGYEFGD